MSAPSASGSDTHAKYPDPSSPAVSVCETTPGTVVFLESGNTDGWIATDSPIDLMQ